MPNSGRRIVIGLIPPLSPPKEACNKTLPARPCRLHEILGLAMYTLSMRTDGHMDRWTQMDTFSGISACGTMATITRSLSIQTNPVDLFVNVYGK